MPDPIACELHDHLEIACLYRYQVRVHLNNGEIHEGIATTTKTLPGKIELLVIQTSDKLLELPMHLMVALDVLTEPANFKRLKF